MAETQDEIIMERMEATQAAKRSYGVAISMRVDADRAERDAKEDLRLAQLAEDNARLEGQPLMKRAAKLTLEWEDFGTGHRSRRRNENGQTGAGRFRAVGVGDVSEAIVDGGIELICYNHPRVEGWSWCLEVSFDDGYAAVQLADGSITTSGGQRLGPTAADREIAKAHAEQGAREYFEGLAGKLRI